MRSGCENDVEGKRTVFWWAHKAGRGRPEIIRKPVRKSIPAFPKCTFFSDASHLSPYQPTMTSVALSTTGPKIEPLRVPAFAPWASLPLFFNSLAIRPPVSHNVHRDFTISRPSQQPRVRSQIVCVHGRR